MEQMIYDYEWVLKTPRTADFTGVETRVVEAKEPVIGSDGNPTVKTTVKTVKVDVITSKWANVVRLAGIHNDHTNHRLFVRLFYGYMDGLLFKPAVLDDGVVFGGPDYVDHNFHADPTAVEEKELLTKLAAALKWDGAMRAVTS